MKDNYVSGEKMTRNGRKSPTYSFVLFLSVQTLQKKIDHLKFSEHKHQKSSIRLTKKPPILKGIDFVY